MPEDIKPEVVQKTQKILGKHVKKPALTEKLLKKPPFRFLHDIVNAVIKETGFLKGLFTDDELNSENVKEKDAKILFLTKLIKAVKTITNTDLAARPSKIIAGLEAAETNVLLQTIGRALDKKLDSSEYVKQVNSGQLIANDKEKSKQNDKPKKHAAGGKDTDKTKTKSKEKLSTDTPKSTDRSGSKKSKSGSDVEAPTNKIKKIRTTPSKEDAKASSRSNNKDVIKTSSRSKEKITTVQQTKENDDRRNEQMKENERNEEIKPAEVEKNDTGKVSPRDAADANGLALGDVETTATTTPESNEEIRRKRTPSASRPKSARPRSGDFREKMKTPEPAPPAPMMTTTTARPKSSLRPPSVRPSSARPGAPRLRPESALPMKELVTLGKINVIVENFDKDADEEETVVIHSSPEMVENETSPIPTSVEVIPEDNKGHLVEQILEQINETEGGDPLNNKPKADIDWQSEGIQSKDVTARETNNLRALIQTLTKTANPLGKLLNYLHEDLETMHAELETWTGAKKQLFAEIGKQKK